MKKKSCKTCDWKLDNGRKLPILHKDIKKDVKLAKEYCENHTFVYGNECEPIWCKECGHLDKYVVTISENSKENPKFDKRK
tara:strand:- start:82 stop:324 length:243 start_codon:yes stop_codon:yes gene_type:complete